MAEKKQEHSFLFTEVEWDEKKKDWVKKEEKKEEEKK